MRWYSVNEFLPGQGTGYVMAYCLNEDECAFVYMAIHMEDRWQFWDEQYWPEGRNKDGGLKVTHWMYIPDLGGF